MKIRTTVVCLPIRNAAATAAFYKNALGFFDLEVEAGMVTLELPNLSLFLMERDAFETYTRKTGRAAQLPKSQAAGIVVSCAMESKAEVDAILRNVPKHGGSVPGAATVDPASGGYIGYFADPEGYLWELVYPQPR
jgi:predicted lactoylglutathione lyase